MKTCGPYNSFSEMTRRKSPIDVRAIPSVHSDKTARDNHDGSVRPQASRARYTQPFER